MAFRSALGYVLGASPRHVSWICQFVVKPAPTYWALVQSFNSSEVVMKNLLNTGIMESKFLAPMWWNKPTKGLHIIVHHTPPKLLINTCGLKFYSFNCLVHIAQFWPNEHCGIGSMVRFDQTSINPLPYLEATSWESQTRWRLTLQEIPAWLRTSFALLWLRGQFPSFAGSSESQILQSW